MANRGYTGPLLPPPPARKVKVKGSLEKPRDKKKYRRRETWVPDI